MNGRLLDDSAILSYMLGLNESDVVVVPKMPELNQFTIARREWRLSIRGS